MELITVRKNALGTGWKVPLAKKAPAVGGQVIDSNGQVRTVVAVDGTSGPYTYLTLEGDE